MKIDWIVCHQFDEKLRDLSQCVMWKFENFYGTQILREINVKDSRCSKTAILQF